MNPALIVTALLWASVASLAFALIRRWTYWRRGRTTTDSTLGWRNLLAMPKRYFVDLHRVVARDPYMARTHIATAGGGVAALALVFVNYGLMIYSPWLDRLILLAASAMLAGAVCAGWRRRSAARPARLSRGAWNALPWLLGAFALGLLLYVAAPASVLCGAFAVLCALLIAIGAGAMTFGAARGGPMKHALAGLLHLAFHPRQTRFDADFAARFIAYPTAYSAARSGVPAVHSTAQAITPSTANSTTQTGMAHATHDAHDSHDARLQAGTRAAPRKSANLTPAQRERMLVPPTALKPLALEQNEYGVGKPADFRWNQLLGFDACVQCGKCEAACPAFAAGQPLNPKKLVQDLVTGMVGGTDAAYAGNPTPGIETGQHRGAPASALVPELIDARTLWSCTTCRACVMECPMLIEHVDAIVDMRRYQTLMYGDVPGKGPQVLASLRETGTAGGYDKAARYDWAVDLNVPVAHADEAVDVLLIAGEGAFDMRYQRTLRALVKALNHAGVNYAVPGGVETDTGDVARRLGDEVTFRQMGRRLIVALSKLRFTRIVSADPHVVHSLRNEYRVLGARFEIVHHSALLAELVAQGRLAVRASDEWRERTFTYHDPCYLGRYNGETSAPRALLKTIGIEIVEMERHGLRGRCCGGGGGAPLTDIPGKQRIPDMRMADARAVGANAIAVACPNCTAMLEGVVGPRPEVLDIAELVAAALE